MTKSCKPWPVFTILNQSTVHKTFSHTRNMNAAAITIFEVGPRDGLQNESAQIPTRDKIALIESLAEAGLKKIEAGSFVSPKWVPQMKDTPQVLHGIRRKDGVTYAALTPNKMGYQFAREARTDEVAVFAAASESFSQKNINCSIAASIERYKVIMDLAMKDNVPVRGYVSCVAGCPYEGKIAPAAVAEVVDQLLDMGCYEVSLGDTIGVGTPTSIAEMLKKVLQITSADKLAGHYHDTYQHALENIMTSIEFGITTYDSAIGGLGGCPYAPGAKGNVNTLTVVKQLNERGHQTGINISKLTPIAEFAKSLLTTNT